MQRARARHAAITKNLYTWSNYKSWADKMRDNWEDEDPNAKIGGAAGVPKAPRSAQVTQFARATVPTRGRGIHGAFCSAATAPGVPGSGALHSFSCRVAMGCLRQLPGGGVEAGQIVPLLGEQLLEPRHAVVVVRLGRQARVVQPLLDPLLV